MSNTKRGGQTALYERLSHDDKMQGENNSITNQKQLLASYAKRNGFVNIYHYTDDRVSGTTFDREGFQKMIKAVEKNKVSTVIVKDMSMFGKDYLKKNTTYLQSKNGRKQKIISKRSIWLL